MTNEEYEQAIIDFLEKTKTMNDQKVKKVLGDKIDELELKKLENKKKDLVNNFKEDITKYYRELKNYYAHEYHLDVSITDGDDYELEDLYFDGNWIKKN